VSGAKLTPEATPGALHVVATPIGNLSDMTDRAVEVLRGCSVIAVEDTRRFRILAERHAIRPRRVVRCDERTEARAAVELVAAAVAGESVALTTDAGTPGIADPGYRVVRLARERGVRVIPVPGACAPIAALSAAGLPTDRFLFAGFPPRTSTRRRAFLESLLAFPATLVLLESPERALALLDDLTELAPARRLVAARELTKLHEELVEGTPQEVRRSLSGASGRLRGELVILVASAEAGAETDATRRAGEILARPWARGLSRRDRADLLEVALGLERNRAYRLASSNLDDEGGEDP
jgi:16S rRNA (cytidine1402-2'-O)-methyltransferase